MALRPTLRALSDQLSARNFTFPFSNRRIVITLCLLFGTIAQPSSAQRTQFDVLKGDAVVGKILASRSIAGDRTTYLMTSYSEFDIIWKQVVRSVANTEYVAGSLLSCHTNMSVNGSLRDSSHMSPIEDQLRCYVHPGRHFIMPGAVTWTTARMYFEEPVDQLTIFVESVLKYCPLERIGPATYRLTMPDEKVNDYVYLNGVLSEIRVDRSFFDLVFRRS